MNNENTPFPELNDDNTDRNRTQKDDLGANVGSEDLVYNEDEESYEIDVASNDPDYQHPDPYDTAGRNGSDFDSDFDEANPTANDEYHRTNDGADPAVTPEYGMHIDSGKIVELDEIDEELAETPEDQRDDLDEEGYPKNDDPDKEGNFL
ncbi:hypothetical protein B0I27_10192 [Arcticibacter pallidicorallinus]|uniref:Uncharacterized protein n=1 Tax=Arcticibacter pallidicorallinus TaxID=1259464 RepID=A0A2T0UBE1_9SPHI|nr:hypothetical protein [Arcticibacter pallidicorallinus]PRY55127.1 hypothetical protein B0I27_10192 [Arcticibacter pallidicorallinus]